METLTIDKQECYIKRDCPSCSQSTNLAKQEICSIDKAEEMDIDEVSKHWYGFYFKRKIFFSYYRCSSCGILYCPQFFSPSQLSLLYSQMPDNTAGVSQSILKKTQKGYFDVLKQYSPLTGEFMEIGADIGLFTQFCVDGGNFSKYWLFEPNKAVHEVLRQKVASHPHQIISEMSDYSMIQDNSISALAVVHVLDHLIDPVQEIQTLKKKLTPNGVMLFVTHNESSLLAKATKMKWPPYCLQHPQLYNPTSITNLLENCGMKVLAIKPSYNFFPITFLTKQVFSLFGFGEIPLPQLEWLNIGLKLGNMITIASPQNE